VKVLDFGIAKLVAESSTRSTRTAMGSPLWMAPEQTAPGPITPAADVWALGLLAYQLFTGKHFWRAGNDETGTTAQLLREIVLDPIPLASQRAGEQACLESLPAGFDGWFARCAARDPALRYPDANAALKAMRPLFGGAEALAATQLVPSGVHATADETGDATPFIAKLHAEGAVVEPQRASGIRPETPVATVREASSSAPRRRAWAPLVAGALVLAGGGVASGFFLAQGNRRGADGTAVSGGVDSVGAVAPSAGTAAREASQPPLPFESDAAVADAAPAGAPSSHPAQPEASAARAEASRESPATRAKSEPTMGEAPKPPPPRTSPAAGKAPAGVGGFFDPADRQGPTQRRMGDRQVRLFVRLAANDSNVQDAVVRRAIEWNSWQYLHCYERTFGAIKELPEGVVTVAYEILDRLPRHATLVSSTIDSAAFNACVVGTLTGQTINAAGPEGKGRVVHAFRFVPM
jgi:serine/threonine-protein kinase